MGEGFFVVSGFSFHALGETSRSECSLVVSSPRGAGSVSLQSAPPVGNKRCFWNVTTIYLTVPSEDLTKGAASEKRVVLGVYSRHGINDKTSWGWEQVLG